MVSRTMEQKKSELAPADAFFQALYAHIGQKPNEGGQYIIGATVKLQKIWAETVYISTIRTPDKLRGKGLAGFAINELGSLADLHGVTLTTDCSGVNNPKKGLSTEALRELFERRGFDVTQNHMLGDGCEMVRKPRAKLSL